MVALSWLPILIITNIIGNKKEHLFTVSWLLVKLENLSCLLILVISAMNYLFLLHFQYFLYWYLSTIYTLRN